MRKLIGFDDDNDFIADAAWLNREFPQARFILRTNSQATQAAAARAGLGVAQLPLHVGHSDPGLVPVTLAKKPPDREIWMLLRRDVARLPRVRAVADYLAAQNGGDEQATAKLIDEALQANADVFIREEQGDDVTYTTSKLGAYRPRTDDLRHMFKQRLYEPENPLPIDDISVVVSTTRPALTTVEPVFISDYWQIQAGLVPVPRGDEEMPIGDDVVEYAAFVEQSETLDLPVERFEQVVVAEEPVVEQEVAQPEVAPVPAAEEQPSTTIALPDGVSIDLSPSREQIVATHGPALEEALLAAIDRDPLNRIVSFGRSVYPQASLVSLGKNDLRRIRDYIMEVGEPLLDTTIIADLYYHNPRQADYEGFRFSLNYRLSREKDFDFVGVEGARLWSTKGLPVVGTKRVKVSEMGQITSYLEEGYDDSLTDQSADTIQQSGSVSRLLTFFEWEYGILPLDSSLKALLPKLMLSDQRSAVLEHGRLVTGRLARGDEPDAVVSDVEARVDEPPEVVAVLLRDAEQDADGLHRQLRGHRFEEVDLGARLDGVEQQAGAPAQLVLEPAHHARGEPRAHQPADPGVAGVVHHAQHRAGELDVLEQRAAVPAVAAPLRRVGGRVAQDLEHLGVGGHGPEALAVGRVLGGFVPEDRGLPPVPREHVVGEAVGEPVEVREVDVGPRLVGRARGGHVPYARAP